MAIQKPGGGSVPKRRASSAQSEDQFSGAGPSAAVRRQMLSPKPATTLGPSQVVSKAQGKSVQGARTPAQANRIVDRSKANVASKTGKAQKGY